VPALEQSFQGLPPEYLGAWTRTLFTCARFLREWGLLLPMSVVVAAVAAWGALPRSCGRLRRLLDHVGPWKLYRQVQALRVLALVAILLQSNSGGSIQLRSVVVLFLQQASPWLRAHLGAMTRRIDQGFTGSAAFDTGLLDRELCWYLHDMDQACGLADALRMTHARMAGLWLSRVRLQAQVLRWGVLLAGVAMVLGVGLWHYVAIDELRRSWMMFHAGQ
jgi:type II secretory pathway component PulF